MPSPLRATEKPKPPLAPPAVNSLCWPQALLALPVLIRRCTAAAKPAGAFARVMGLPGAGARPSVANALDSARVAGVLAPNAAAEPKGVVATAQRHHTRRSRQDCPFISPFPFPRTIAVAVYGLTGDMAGA